MNRAARSAGSLPAARDARRTLSVIGAPIDVVDAATALQRIRDWADRREGRYVCICNVHSVVTASKDPAFMRAIQGADMATPDGAPVAWMLRRLGAKTQPRVSGPDLMWDYCALAADCGQSIFLLGSTPETLDLLQARLLRQWPALRIAGALSPPFRTLRQQEQQTIVDQINASGAGTVWVGLGCPKQELWMAAHRDRLRAVAIGVGAAFDFHAGVMTRAPRWMQRSGLEWTYRLALEPRRLARRYLETNTAFVVGALRQLLRRRQDPSGAE
jgi:N-acetylglucosaminyldiphosphoundecaprenol N-acetyl-beta-D-mannosaminyltransferase